MRTQIAVGAEQHALLKRRAAELGISMAEYIRRLIDRDLGDRVTGGDISAIFGIWDSGGSNIAVDRKQATAEAIAARSTAR